MLCYFSKWNNNCYSTIVEQFWTIVPDLMTDFNFWRIPEITSKDKIMLGFVLIQEEARR